MVLINGKIIINAVYDNNKVKHFDANGNRVYEEYDDYNLYQVNDFIIVYDVEYDEYKIYDENFKLIKNFEYVTISFPVAIRDGVIFYMFYLGDDGVEVEYYYLKGYNVLDGANQDYYDGDLEVRFSGEYNLFSKVLINNNEISSDKYTVSEGSTIIKLKDSYLDTLSNGEYTISAVYKNGVVTSTKFNKMMNNPETGDSLLSYIILLVISSIGLGYSIMRKRCK